MFFVREIEEKDYENLAKLLIEQFEQEVVHKKTSLKQLEARIIKCKNSKDLTVLIAIEDSCIKGCLILHWLQELCSDTPEALISSLYVGLDSREKGIGKALLDEAVQKAKNRDCSRLWLENNRKNPIYDRQFYKKRGWKEQENLAVFEYPF